MPDLWDSISEIDEEQEKQKSEKETSQEKIKKQSKKSEIKITPEIPKPPKKSTKQIGIKTDHFRTGYSLIVGTSKREKPPILQKKLIEFLQNHKLTQKGKDWSWVMKD